jgi:putative ABC transport system permease protein
LREVLVGKARPAILVVITGVLTIGLATYASVAGLLIGRSVSRERELVIKEALGASNAALFGEDFLESLLLAFVGAGAGTLVATMLLPLMATLVPASMEAWAHLSVDARSLLFAFVTSIVADGVARCKGLTVCTVSVLSMRSVQ